MGRVALMHIDVCMDDGLITNLTDISDDMHAACVATKGFKAVGHQQVKEQGPSLSKVHCCTQWLGMLPAASDGIPESARRL